MPNPGYNEEILERIKEDIGDGDKSDLIVFNDDVNTIEWVVECFVEVCRLSPEEAVEKTLYIHYNGQGIVRSGEYSEMKAMKDELVRRGLTAIVGRAGKN